MRKINFNSKLVNVLGTEYTVEFRNVKDDKQLEDLGGYCDSTIKLIVIEKIEPDIHTVKDLSVYYNKIMLHELIHAFIYECSMQHEDWSEESLCCYMSIMLPKIYEAYDKIKF